MPKQKYQKPERPKLRRRRPGPPQWLVLDPTRLALVGGSFFATLAMAFSFVRQWLGAPMGAAQTAIGVALTFVVSYTATGLFVYFLLRIAERELPVSDDVEAQKKGRLPKREDAKEEMPAVLPEEAAEAEHPEENSE